MNETCPYCGREVCDTTELCKCGTNIAALRWRQRAEIAEGAIEGWRKVNAQLQDEINRLRITLDAKTEETRHE